jgi:hypothetical protein
LPTPVAAVTVAGTASAAAPLKLAEDAADVVVLADEKGAEPLPQAFDVLRRASAAR